MPGEKDYLQTLTNYSRVWAQL